MAKQSQPLGLLILIVAFFISGCSGKKYYDPEEAHDLNMRSYGEVIINLSRDGATLKSGRYIGKSGLVKLSLGKGYRFLSENEKYILASNAEGILNIIDKAKKESMRAVALHIPVVAASIHNGLVAYILNNNTFGIYEIEDNKKIMESRSERTFAIDTRAASPFFVENIAVMPMLDGKLIIVDSLDTENSKVVYLSSKRTFNNVIFLSRISNTLVASTSKMLIALGVGGKQEYAANISEIAIDEQTIYAFTKEGKIVALNTSLQELASIKFEFAHFAVATAFDKKVYVLDQQGSLIVLSSDLKRHKTYALGSLHKPAFISGTKLYKDGKVIELSKLGYK